MTLQLQQAAQKISTQRISSIEIVRILAIIAVVSIHSHPFGFAKPPHYKYTLAMLIDLACRFAVPFFFMASGYFLTAKILAGKPVMATFWRSVRRLASVYIVWCVIYVLVPARLLSEIPSHGWLTSVIKNLSPIQAVGWGLPLAGTYQSLWFLPALMCGLGIVAVTLACGWRKYLPALAIALYTLGLICGSYSLLWPEFANMVSPRNGPLFSTMYVMLGWLIATRQKQGRWSVGVRGAIALILSGLLLTFSEAWGLSAAAAIPIGKFEYLVGTVPLSVGIFSLALAKPDWGSRWPVFRWSRYTLGIYLIHPIFIKMIEPVGDRFNNAIWEMSFPLIIYALSLAAVALIARSRFLRQWVT